VLLKTGGTSVEQRACGVPLAVAHAGGHCLHSVLVAARVGGQLDRGFLPVNWPGLLAGVFAGRTVGRALNNPRLADFIVSNEARPAVANALATVPSPLSLALASALRGAPVTVETDPRRPNNGR